MRWCKLAISPGYLAFTGLLQLIIGRCRIVRAAARDDRQW